MMSDGAEELKFQIPDKFSMQIEIWMKMQKKWAIVFGKTVGK